MNKLNKYETIFILKQDLSDDEKKSQINKVSSTIKANGEIISVEEWGKKRLAYEIKKHKNGYYVFITYKADGSIIANLNRYFKINDQVLRHLTIHIEKRNINKVKPVSNAEVSAS